MKTTTGWIARVVAVAALIGTSFPTAVAEEKLFHAIDPDVAYAAWRHMRTDGQEAKMREYRASGRMRFEMEQEGQEMVILFDETSGESWMLMPSMKMYMKTSTDRFAGGTGSEVEVLERTDLGRESVNGHASRKYRARFRDAEGREGRGHYWLTEAHGIPIRMDMVQESSRGEVRVFMELTDLVIRPQPAALFEVPDDYRAMPGGMGLGGMGSAYGGSAGDTAGEPPPRPTPESASRTAQGEEGDGESAGGDFMDKAADGVGETAEKIKKGIGSFLNKF
ncbi:MAG: DUF4412 domain-containing protein [Gammaproteobacteria bacterium]|nr:DUF4412 domain-containing protein [Gammaproteobacteria bacterium]